MSRNPYRQLADNLADELREYLIIRDELISVQALLNEREPNSLELRGLGKLLYDAYNGAEGILRHIAKEIDQRLPTGASWHRELLDQMSEPIPNGRPVVIEPNTLTLLENYRRFRHVFQSIYGFNLDWSQMKPLLDGAIPTINTFESDIEQFINFLRMRATDA